MQFFIKNVKSQLPSQSGFLGQEAGGERGCVCFIH